MSTDPSEEQASAEAAPESGSPADAGEPESSTTESDGEHVVTDEALAALIDESAAADHPSPADAPVEELSEEAVVALIAERDEYLDQLQRAKAEFANARRRSDERAELQRAQAAAGLVEKLLPILDSCEAALGQGVEDIRPVSDALFEVLASQGLERLDAVGEPFDPQLHEAVMYEAGEGEQVVIEILRTGYRWNDRVLRAPMVKVQG